MNYRLGNWSSNYRSTLDLTASEYTDILEAMRRIDLAKDVEEKLDLLLENYLEYEGELLSIGLRNSLFIRLDDHRMSSERLLINRRTLNLLTAAKTYIDQVKHAVSRYFGPGQPRKAEVDALFSAEYDQHLEYRVAEELRNHAQHRSLPVHALSWTSQWEDMDSREKRLRFWIVPSFSVDELTDEGGFKPSVLQELQASGRPIWPLTPVLRRYVESLATVHITLRDLLSSQAEGDHQALLRARERAEAELGSKLDWLGIAALDDDGNIRERHYIFERSWERRTALMSKNNILQNLSRRYVSGEHPGDIT